MINIAICDDEQGFLENFKEIVFSEFKKYNVVINIVTFDKGTELIDNICDFHIVFLDVDMPGLSGEDIAEYIKKNNCDTLIVFVTNYSDFVFSSFKYRPFGFVRKRFVEDETRATVENIMGHLVDLNAVFVFSSQGNTISIKYSEIIYFEAYGHEIIVHTSNGHYTTSESLAKIEKKVQGKNFTRTHKSYLVNCDYIFSIEKNEVLLNNKSSIPLSRHRINDVKQNVIDFSRGY